ncbi:MAG: 16S rRNA (cytosine(1402)-N(4))-methyltransferase RsmH [Dehalococcoidia bacterium]
MNQQSIHIPVLLNETIEAFQVQVGRKYIDCTVGEGGHAAAILEKGAHLLGIDIDPQAIDVARKRLQLYGENAILINEDFENLERICSDSGFHPVHGVLFDLGMSSLQLTDTSRGFSFQHDSPLNMRFSPSHELNAATIVNTFTEEELAVIIEKYGEERRSKQIARSIVANRPIDTTLRLATVIERTVGFRGKIHPATKTFQALRITVNQELQRLETALKQVANILFLGGRLVVISFHSLEDRLVKHYMRQESKDCICPPQTLVCVCGHKATFKLITKKVITPSPAEILANPRSRSARMRVAERV